MRVGDAERAAIADRLAHHFSDGRLDEAELNDRLDRAMRAKTMGDLTGLLADLPETEPAIPPVQPPTGGKRHQQKMLKMQLQQERLRLQHVQKERRRTVRQERFRTLRWLPVLIVAVVLAAVAVHWLTHSIVAWLVIGLIAVLWLRSRDRRYRNY
jgi:DUF1707 SHOCT-like domain